LEAFAFITGYNIDLITFFCGRKCDPRLPRDALLPNCVLTNVETGGLSFDAVKAAATAIGEWSSAEVVWPRRKLELVLLNV
jgi:hypothetical protein